MGSLSVRIAPYHIVRNAALCITTKWAQQWQTAMADKGQKAKFSLRANVFRYSPNIGHSTVPPSGHVSPLPSARLNGRQFKLPDPDSPDASIYGIGRTVKMRSHFGDNARGRRNIG
jgi:hypothetical protein